MKVLGVIPARGGSKGVPRKNLSLVAGRPLLAYTVDAAHASRHLARVIVSTDDPAIADAARALGVEVPFLRPAELASDDAPMLPVLQHALQKMARNGFAADAVVLLQPTSPLRRAEHIDGAIKLLRASGADSVVSVVEVPHQFSPVSVMSLDGDRLRPYADGPLLTRRQDKPKVFARNGPAVLAVRADVIAAGSLYGHDCRPLVMTAADSVDVDSEEDLAAAEVRLKPDTTYDGDDRGLRIPYRRIDEYQKVDISQLRPGGSYKQLIEKRTHPIDELVRVHGKIPDDLLTPRACPTCGSDQPAPELDKDHMHIVRCTACDLVYVSPTFDETHYKTVYRSAEYQDIVRDLGIKSHEYRVQRFGRERIRIMSEHLHTPHPRMLDVGCSTGFVVEAARDAGWDAIGLDLNPSAVEYGCSRALDLRNVALEDAGFGDASFDALSLFDVLEHLHDPVRTLRACTRLLRPGGILFLYVPNYDSASRLLMGRDAHFIWPTHHLNYYTPVTLRDLLRREGMRTEYLATEGLDIVDYLWYRREVHDARDEGVERIADLLQFFANAGAYGKNLRAIGRKQ
jgi:CMP-N-acetylneuraminic acid synthetase/2-polyprenyl-3-methyl-5-hydroxy-6-metoxy-1,4-benzoquinol methylase